MSLNSFMQALLASASHSSTAADVLLQRTQMIIEVSPDNAKMPSPFLLAKTTKTVKFKTIPHQSSRRRQVSRHHSAPIMTKHNDKFQQQQLPKISKSSRWAATPALPTTTRGGQQQQQGQTTQQLVMPKRTRDSRWAVARNHSDPTLLKLPRRSKEMPVTHSVLSSLQRKCSASKVISDMAAHSSRRRLSRKQQQQTSSSSPLGASQVVLDDDDDADMNEMDMNHPESLIEQLIDVPNERRQREGDERFIRSILEIPERVTDDAEECQPAHYPHTCLRAKAYDTLQAMLGVVLIVLKVLWMELIRPAATNCASQLIQTLLQVMPGGAESNGKTRELFLPLVVGNDYDDGILVRDSKGSHILQGQESWGHAAHRNEAVIII